LLAGLSSPAVRVIDLASTREQAPSGRMFWDPATDRWTFFAHGLPALRAGRDYQLWLITPEGPVGAGTFKPDSSGGARVQATFDLPADRLRAVAVTEEPEGGLPQPSGTPIILGASD
ncbi:MAG TPA: anti-sigma factor, partial [Longimicrobium sp.]|nr:anti-sigma factor [Longimicrobium sp.]